MYVYAAEKKEKSKGQCSEGDSELYKNKAYYTACYTAYYMLIHPNIKYLF